MLDHVLLDDLPAYAQRLLDAAARDDEIVLTRNGRPLAQLLPATSVTARRRAVRGVWKGQVDMSRFDDFDDEIAAEFGLLE